MHELVHLELTLEARQANENKLFISNNGNKEAFIKSIIDSINNLKSKNIPASSIDKIVDDLFHGLNSQIFNSAPDLFIEDRLSKKFPEIRMLQFISLQNMINQGIHATTNKDIIELTRPWIVSTSKTLNLLNAIQYKEFFNIDLLSKFKASNSVLKQAQTLYDEFLEYREDIKPGEELKLDKNFQIVDENQYRNKQVKKDEFADDILNKIISDPYDLD